jgi:hypothetical protein
VKAPLLAATLSLVVPGAGQVYAGARRRGLVLLSIAAALSLGVLAVLATGPLGLALSLLGRPLLAGVLIANLAFLALRVFAVVDAWRLSARMTTGMGTVALVALTAVTAAPHAAVGYAAVRGYSTLETVFAEEEPTDVLPAEGSRPSHGPAARRFTPDPSRQDRVVRPCLDHHAPRRQRPRPRQ